VKIISKLEINIENLEKKGAKEEPRISKMQQKEGKICTKKQQKA